MYMVKVCDVLMRMFIWAEVVTFLFGFLRGTHC